MLAAWCWSAASGCSLIFPDISHQPVVHNPFPQLNKVAIAPFFNQSDETTVDGRKFALAYFAELQVSAGLRGRAAGRGRRSDHRNHVNLSNPGEARRLANILGVDAVVIGSVTDYTPYYPPRCGLRVEWYAANPGFHEIPPGYGLPWGTPEEEYIPAPLVFESEFALAKAQLATQTPACDSADSDRSPASMLPMPGTNGPQLEPTPPQGGSDSNNGNKQDGSAADRRRRAHRRPAARKISDSCRTTRMPVVPTRASGANESEHGRRRSRASDAAGHASIRYTGYAGNSGATGTTGAIGAGGALPPNWPDERGFIPPPPSPGAAALLPNNGPVMTHTRIYHGNDSEFTEALASYYHFRDDARFGGWQNYLQRSDDFIRFCCHMHIREMLSARGGAGETRVVWQWSDCR